MIGISNSKTKTSTLKYKKNLILCRIPIPLCEDLPGLSDLSDIELQQMIVNWRRIDIFASKDALKNKNYSVSLGVRLFNEVEKRWLKSSPKKRDNHKARVKLGPISFREESKETS